MVGMGRSIFMFFRVKEVLGMEWVRDWFSVFDL